MDPRTVSPYHRRPECQQEEGEAVADRDQPSEKNTAVTQACQATPAISDSTYRGAHRPHESVGVQMHILFHSWPLLPFQQERDHILKQEREEASVCVHGHRRRHRRRRRMASFSLSRLTFRTDQKEDWKEEKRAALLKRSSRSLYPSDACAITCLLHLSMAGKFLPGHPYVRPLSRSLPSVAAATAGRKCSQYEDGSPFLSIHQSFN